MVFLRILRLRYEVNMLQPHRAQTHVNSPFAHHRLHFKVPTVVLEWKAVFCAKLHQRICCFTGALLVRDGNREQISKVFVKPSLFLIYSFSLGVLFP